MARDKIINLFIFVVVVDGGELVSDDRLGRTVPNIMLSILL